METLQIELIRCKILLYLKRLSKLKEARWSRDKAKQWPHTFDNVDRFVMFVGFPRSSHSLVGSLLDAHPEACIAHEMDVLKYVMANFRNNSFFTCCWLMLCKQVSKAESKRAIPVRCLANSKASIQLYELLAIKEAATPPGAYKRIPDFFEN